MRVKIRHLAVVHAPAWDTIDSVNEKHLSTLELPKILERLASYCSFNASAELARHLIPSTDAAEVQRRLAETTQARAALETNDGLTIGGAHDVRELVARASRGGVLEPQDLLDNPRYAGQRAQRPTYALALCRALSRAERDDDDDRALPDAGERNFTLHRR